VRVYIWIFPKAIKKARQNGISPLVLENTINFIIETRRQVILEEENK